MILLHCSVFNRKVIRAVLVGAGLIAIFVLASEVADRWVAGVTCLVLVLSVRLASRSCYLFSFQHVSMTSFWYLTYLAMIFFPAFVVYFFQEGLYRGRYLFAVESVLLTVPLGWSFATWLWNFDRTEIGHFYRSDIASENFGNGLMLRCWLMLLVCLGMVVSYLFEVHTIPLFYLIKHPGEAVEVAFLREESFKTLDSHLTYFYILVRGVLFPLLITVALGAYLETRRKLWLFTLLVSITSGLFFAALSVAKAPVALIFLVLGIFYYVFKRGRLSRKVVAVLLILIFLFPIVVVAFLAGSDSATAPLVLAAIAYRLFYIPAEGVYYYFEIFPRHIPYLHGRATDKLAKLFGVPSVDAPNVVGTYAYPTGLETVSANAAFISDLNADFGMWGVILGGIATGMIMQSAQIYLLRRRKTVVTVAMFSFLIVVFWYLNSASLPVVLLSDGGALALIVGWYLDPPNAGRLVVSKA